MNARSKAMKEAIRVELRLLLEVEDLDKDTLGRIERLAGYAQSMVKVLDLPVGAAQNPPDVKTALEDTHVCSNDDVTLEITPTPVLPEQTPGETFGARMLREILAILPSMRPQVPTADQIAEAMVRIQRAELAPEPLSLARDLVEEHDPLPPAKMPETVQEVVHAMEHGATLCGKHKLFQLPDGHKWVPLTEMGSVTCPECRP